MSNQSKVRPITPAEAVAAKTGLIPPEVFAAFNELITQKFDGGVARVYQADVIALIREKMKSPNDRCESWWLNVEDAYREAGWTVAYDKPGFNESYAPYFMFTADTTQWVGRLAAVSSFPDAAGEDRGS